jgi:hypothetical protein
VDLAALRPGVIEGSSGAGGGPETATLLDALDRVREVRGSVPIFDALVADAPERLRTALAAAPRHPLREPLEAWLLARGVRPMEQESAAEALARHGITDLDAWVADQARRETALARSLDDARAERELALRSANAYALVAALLAAVAIVGWVRALQDFSPVTEPAPTHTAAPSEPSPP